MYLLYQDHELVYPISNYNHVLFHTFSTFNFRSTLLRPGPTSENACLDTLIVWFSLCLREWNDIWPLLIVNDRDTNQTAQANEMLFSLRCERRLYFPPVGFSPTFVISCHSCLCRFLKRYCKIRLDLLSYGVMLNVLAIYTVLTMISSQGGNKINKVSLLVHTCGLGLWAQNITHVFHNHGCWKPKWTTRIR